MSRVKGYCVRQRKEKSPGRWRKRLLRMSMLFGAALATVLSLLVGSGWKAFGRQADGARRARMLSSPQWMDGRFRNPQPMSTDFLGAFIDAFRANPNTSPKQPPAVLPVDKKRLELPSTTGMRVVWLGHSTILLELDGHRILTDPVWSERVSPFPWVGPRRWYAPLIALEELPPIDVVVISHDHYDHLDYATVSAMREWPTTFVVPLGVGAHLAYWGIPESRIVELDWWESTRVRDLEIVATPARHASGRTAMFRQDQTLWAGFSLRSPRHKVWYSGDTGIFPAMREIGKRLGPFDLTIIEAGAYGRSWPDWHLGPEQAIKAHQMVGGRSMLAVHWGLLNLAYHPWTEPIERILVAAEQTGTRVMVPRPGQLVEPEVMPREVERWWPEVPWLGAAERPIVSTTPVE